MSSDIPLPGALCVKCGAEMYFSTLREVPSPVLPVLEDSNSVLSPQDRKIACAVAKNVTQTIDNLEEELDIIDTMLSNLSVARNLVAAREDEISAFGIQHRRLYCTDSGRRISLDSGILSRIFVHHQNIVLPAWPLTPHEEDVALQDDTDEPDSFSVSSGPLLFTGICRSWRESALATPTLWSNILFVEKNGKSPSVELINLWMERAGQMPLSVVIKEKGFPHDQLEISQPLVAARRINLAKARLMECSASWKKFHYVCSPQEVLENVANSTISFKGKLPLLRSLTLQNRTGIKDADFLPLEPTSGQHAFDAPRLEQLIILDWPTYYLTTIAFPLSQLKTLILAVPYRLPYKQHQNTIKVSTFFDILSECFMLDDLIITCGPWSPEDLPFGVTNNHLTRLNVALDPKYSGDFLGRITLPALLELQIFAFPGPVDDSTGRAIQSLCGRSPHLKAIEMVTGNISGVTVAGCLENAPKCLEHFKVLFPVEQLEEIVQCLKGLSPTSFSPIVRRCSMFRSDGAFGIVATTFGNLSDSNGNIQQGSTPLSTRFTSTHHRELVPLFLK